jgi:glucosylceramidase
METWFTECAGGDWAPDFGDNLRWNVATLVIGATRHWARGVLLWNLALSERHGPHLGGCGNCRGVITIDSATGSVTRNEEFYALAHASRFVRPGAVRVASTSGADSVHSVAFHHHDQTLVLVAVNLAGAPRRLRVQSGERGFAAALPAGAVATFTWR